MGEQRHYRRPPQNKRRSPQIVIPCVPEDRPELRYEPEGQSPRRARRRPQQKPSPKPRAKPLRKLSSKLSEQWIKWRGQTLVSAKKYAKRGVKRAEHSLLQAQLAVTRARRRAERRKKETQAKRDGQFGAFSVGGRREQPKRCLNRLNPRYVVMAGLFCVAIWSAAQLVGFGARYVQTRRLEKQLSAMHSEAFAVYGQETQAEDMREETPAETAAPIPTEAPAPTPTPAQEARQTVTPVPETVKTTQYQRMGGTPLAQMEALHAQNTDLVAWLTIDNVLDLPVVYRNNSYYLTHDFAKNKSTAGTIFLDENHPMTEKTQNLLLHGHNMKDGTMFGRLTQYEKSIDYLKAHPFVDFSTLWHQERYVIFAVVDVSLDTSSENFLDYFAHPRFSSDAEFASYIRRAELASMYAIPMDVKPSDALLTLSTCLEENRLVVIARRQRDGESKASLRETVNMAVRQ